MADDPPPFTQFNDTFGDLSSLLDNIESEAAKGQAEGATAYGDACSGKKNYGTDSSGNVSVDSSGQPNQVTTVQKGSTDIIKAVTDGLSSDQLGYLSGLATDSFNNNDEDGMRTDVLNSAYSAWDKSAAAYMKADTSGGDSARSDLQSRLQEFDSAVQGQGDPAVSPDQ